MSFWVYMLKCSDESYYIGHTENLEMRVWQHQSGDVPGYTLNRRPVTLVYSQDHPTRLEALTSDRQIKGWSRKKKEALVRGDWDTISRLAHQHGDHKCVRPATEPVLSFSKDSGRTQE